MDIRKKELYEVFADSLEKSRTKEGGLLFDKLFEDMWEHIEPKLGQSLPIDSVVSTSVCDEPDEPVERCKCCKSFHEPDVCCYD